jgi:hypothetical protein
MPVMMGHRYEPDVDLASLEPSQAQCMRCQIIRTVSEGGEVRYSWPPGIRRNAAETLAAAHDCRY